MNKDIIIKGLEEAKNFVGFTIVTRGYGQEAYDHILRALKEIENAQL